MDRLLGILKVGAVLAADAAVFWELFRDARLAGAAAAGIGLYVLLGGYLTLWREGAVSWRRLPAAGQTRLERARELLAEEVRRSGGGDGSRLKLYLIPGAGEMNATAYGAGCVSVTQGTLDGTDPVTLVGVLAHEFSHLRHLDPEFNRAVFASVTLVVAALSVASFAVMAVIFLLFLAGSFFRSWLGLLAFQGAAKATGGLFQLMQRVVVGLYRSVLALVSRRAEYRCDRYACELGYGVQLAHFLSLAAVEDGRCMSLTEALYRSHPPTEKRIARLEAQLGGRGAGRRAG